MSWDATNIYVGYRGDWITDDADRYFHFYIRGAGPGATYTESADRLPGAVFAFGTGPTWTPNIDAPGTDGANWHFYMRTDNGLEGVRTFTGGAWSFPLTAPVYSSARGGTLGTSTAFIEYAISREDLGLGAAGSTLYIRGAVYDNGTTSGARFPTLGGGGGGMRVLAAPLGDAKPPTYAPYLITP